MRITTKIISWGKTWWPKFPKIDLDACYPKSDDGESTFDEDNFRMQVRLNPMIMMSSDDHGSTCAFAAILIASMNDWLNDNDVERNDERSQTIRHRMNRRLNNGNFSYCRLDITDVAVEWNGKLIRGVRVNITTKRNDAFESHPFEHDFAMILADFCRCYSNKYVARGEPPLVFTDNTKQLFADLHSLTEEGEREESNGKRSSCERFRDGYCAPCKFDCPHYKNGKCVEI